MPVHPINGGGGGSGTVTQVNTGTGLTGGPITDTGTIAIANTAVSAGSYTNANITVNAQGQLTAASNGTAASSAVNVQSGSTYTVSTSDAGGVIQLAYSSGNITITIPDNLGTIQFEIQALARITGVVNLVAGGSLVFVDTTYTTLYPGQSVTCNTYTYTSAPYCALTIGGGVPNLPQNAHQVLAGPTSGGAALPTFRSLVFSDIPSSTSGASNTIVARDGDGAVTAYGFYGYLYGVLSNAILSGTYTNVSDADGTTPVNLYTGTLDAKRIVDIWIAQDNPAVPFNAGSCTGLQIQVAGGGPILATFDIASLGAATWNILNFASGSFANMATLETAITGGSAIQAVWLTAAPTAASFFVKALVAYN